MLLKSNHKTLVQSLKTPLPYLWNYMELIGVDRGRKPFPAEDLTQGGNVLYSSNLAK